MKIEIQQSESRGGGVMAAIAIIAVILAAVFSAFTWYNAKRHPVREVVYLDKWGSLRGQVIAATVTAFQPKSELIVFKLDGKVRVRATKSIWLLTGTQELFVPASVNYTVNLQAIKPSDIGFDAQEKVLYVRLPPIQISRVTLDMLHVGKRDGGIPTMSEPVRRELEQLNYKNANAAFLRLANERRFVDAARSGAQKNVSALLTIPLKAVGSGEITVRAY